MSVYLIIGLFLVTHSFKKNIHGNFIKGEGQSLVQSSLQSSLSIHSSVYTGVLFIQRYWTQISCVFRVHFTQVSCFFRDTGHRFLVYSGFSLHRCPVYSEILDIGFLCIQGSVYTGFIFIHGSI